MSNARILSGILIWIAVGFGLWRCIDARLVADGTATGRLVPTLWQYATGTPRRVVLQIDEPVPLAVGDPIFVAMADAGARQVGEIKAVTDPATGLPSRQATVRQAEAFFYASAPTISPRAKITYYEMPESLGWVIDTLLPPEKKKRIAREISTALETHHAEILAALKPVIEESLREGYEIVEQDLATALDRHRAELESLGEKYQREIVEREIVPLVKNEIWPSLRRHAEPAATNIGMEIWQRASLWRFGWRYAYDTMPLTDRRLVEKEWQRFVDIEAMPVLEKHSDELVEVVQKVVTDALRNQEVRGRLKKSIAEIADDPELQRLLWQISREVVIENGRLADAMEKPWSSPQARRALEMASERMQPTIRQIGRMIFQGDDGGLTPQFAQVLRSRLLGKDRRFLLIEPADREQVASGSTNPVVLRVRRGSDDPINPFASPRLSSSDGRLR